MTTTEQQQQQTPPANQEQQQTPPENQQQQQQTPPSEQTTSQQTQTDLGSPAEEDNKDQTVVTDLGADDEDPDKKKEETPDDPYKDFRGPPEGGAYEDFTLPDGAIADTELKDMFQPLAAELGLSQAGAQKLVDFKAKMDQHGIKIWRDHLTALQTASKADEEIGGAKYNESVQLGRSAIAKFGTPALRTVLNNYGVGAHPEMIRFMAKVGRAMGETPTITEGAGGGGKQKPLHETLYDHPTSQPKP